MIIKRLYKNNKKNCNTNKKMIIIKKNIYLIVII